MNAHSWVLAIRPKTLPAGVTPVIVGTALAAADNAFMPLPALAAFICAVLMQIASNLINDLYDFRKGADSAERLGPLRVVATGLLSEMQVKRAAYSVMLLAFVLGQYLVWIGGWQIFAIGVLSLLTAFAYTGGPKPLSYIGLGEVCAFIFFGIVAVVGTYFVQAHAFSWTALGYACVPGLWSANILLVNNIRDIRTDAEAGKRTLAVRLGEQNARLLYCILSALALIIPMQLAFFLFPIVHAPAWLFAPILAAPFGLMRCRAALNLQGAALNKLLGETVQMLILHGMLVSMGVVLAQVQY